MFSFKEKYCEREEILRSINIAHVQWKEKERYFEEVTDPDLIDFAIYEMEASKIKYIYLLKRFKRELGEPRIMAKNKAE